MQPSPLQELSILFNMASACAMGWVPDSLYNMAVSAIVTSYTRHRRELKSLPERVQFDIYYKLYNKGRLCQLGIEFSELETFSKVLKVNDKRDQRNDALCFAVTREMMPYALPSCVQVPYPAALCPKILAGALYEDCNIVETDRYGEGHLLHHCFQALMDHGVRVSEILSETFFSQLAAPVIAQETARDKIIQLGFSLGGFLSDAGWYFDSEKVYQSCLQLCQGDTTVPSLCRALDCSVRLLHVQNSNCKFREANSTCKGAFQILDKLLEQGISVSKASLYTECCALLFAESQYDEAFRHCSLAMKELTTTLPQKAIVDILRQCSKVCVVKREFAKAEILVKHAVSFARECFGVHHPKYSDALLDYGFYLLNVDSITAAVHVYQNALDIRQSVFGGNNLHVATAHEDLAYASYVQEYNSGKFTDAKDHAEKAIEILGNILQPDHLLLSSSKRVKALILEEIAIDSHNKEVEERLLNEAEELHLQSLALARKAFGENNVQTAKHYGNLGRLYQSMHRFKEAEEMHLQAIEIKERLLGAEDYEVSLSVGHLASLYNYDMGKYDEAEALYLRSIKLGKKLFGEGYSGLEYDYRGLLRLYRQVGNQSKAAEYAHILQQWNQIRDRNNAVEVKPLDYVLNESLTDIVNSYL